MKVSDNIDRIDKTMANSYFVNFNGEKILVDAGTPGSGKRILAYLENSKIRPDAVLITHYHPDHVGGLLSIYSRYHMEIYVPSNEANIISGVEKIPSKPFMPKIASMIMHAKSVKEIKPVSEMSFKGINYMKTPGHTRDSTSYTIAGENIIFSGDAAVNLHGKPGYNKAFSAAPAMAEKSVKDIESMHCLILPGHGNIMDFRKSV